MPVTQAELDHSRNRRGRWRAARGLTRSAAHLTLSAVVGGLAGLGASALIRHEVVSATPIATITRLTVSPDAAPGSLVILAATEAGANGAHPAGWVQFEEGDTDIGSPVAVSPAGTATTTAVIPGALPATAPLRASFIPATTTFLASATIS